DRFCDALEHQFSGGGGAQYVDRMIHRGRDGGIIERRAELFPVTRVGVHQHDEQAARAHCNSVSSTLSRRPHLSKKWPSLSTSGLASRRLSSACSRKRAVGLSSGPPSGAVTGKNDAPSHSRPAPANRMTISPQSVSVPMRSEER